MLEKEEATWEEGQGDGGEVSQVSGPIASGALGQMGSSARLCGKLSVDCRVLFGVHLRTHRQGTS